MSVKSFVCKLFNSLLNFKESNILYSLPLGIAQVTLDYFDSIHRIKKKLNESMCENERNEPVNYEFKIMKQRSSLHQIMTANNEANSPFNYFFNSLF